MFFVGVLSGSVDNDILQFSSEALRFFSLLPVPFFEMVLELFHFVLAKFEDSFSFAKIPLGTDGHVSVSRPVVSRFFRAFFFLLV